MEKKVSRGFTLLELVVVITLIVLMASIVAPRLIQQHESASERGEVRRLLSFLRTAKETAVMRGESVTVRVDVEGGMTMQTDSDEAVVGSRGPLAGYSMADREVSGLSSGGDEMLIVFYPDGTSTGGVLTYEYTKTGDRLRIEIDEVSGVIRAQRGELESPQENKWRAGDHEKRL